MDLLKYKISLLYRFLSRRWIWLFIFLPACVTVYDTINNRNLAYLYSPAESNLHPEYTVFHQSDSITQLFLRLFPSEFMFLKNENRMEETKIKIYYHLVESFAGINIIDSNSYLYSLRNDFVNNKFVTNIPLRIKPGSKLVAEIRLTDINRGITHSSFHTIDKTNAYNEQNILLVNDDFSPLFQKFAKPGARYKIKTRGDQDSVFVNIYPLEASLPPPPDQLLQAETSLKPDTGYWFVLRDTSWFRFQQRGMYFFSFAPDNRGGLGIFNFGLNFPRLKEADELLEPLQYLTTKKEYKKYLDLANPKLAVDTFWMAATGNAGRAREAIRIFYNRVQLANYYFTSITQGWKTDRGMIYIVYGAPMMLYKTDSTERWVYDKNNQNIGMEFIFTNQKNIFTCNHFVLRRGEPYQKGWYQAVNTWRAGYTFDFYEQDTR